MEIFSCLDSYVGVSIYPYTVFLTDLSLVPITQAEQGKWASITLVNSQFQPHPTLCIPPH